MGTLLKSVGGIWAAIGAVDMVAMNRVAPGNSALLGLGLILFVFPGLVVSGIGELLSRRKAAQPAATVVSRP